MGWRLHKAMGGSDKLSRSLELARIVGSNLKRSSCRNMKQELGLDSRLRFGLNYGALDKPRVRVDASIDSHGMRNHKKMSDHESDESSDESVSEFASAAGEAKLSRKMEKPNHPTRRLG